MFKVGDEVKVRPLNKLEADNRVSKGDINTIKCHMNKTLVITRIASSSSSMIKVKYKDNSISGLHAFYVHEIELAEPILDISLV